MTPASPMITRGRLLGCSLVFLLFLLAAAGLIWWDEVAPVHRAEKTVAENGPGVGAKREEVEAWFDRQGIRHVRGSSVLEGCGYPAIGAPSDFADLAPNVQGGYVAGSIDAPHLYGWASQVWIYFFFDSDGRLIQHIVKRWDGYL